jgi:excisionase family DNA binding protein
MHHAAAYPRRDRRARLLETTKGDYKRSRARAKEGNEMTEKKPIARREYPVPPPGRISLSLAEVCGLTGIGMTKVRQAIDAELLPVRRLGKKIVVRRPDVDSFLQKLPSGLAKRECQVEEGVIRRPA